MTYNKSFLKSFIIQIISLKEFSLGFGDYLWYWACKKLNSSLMRSHVSVTVNLNGCPGCGGPYHSIKNLIKTWFNQIKIFNKLI
jgi:hypothetical protein